MKPFLRQVLATALSGIVIVLAGCGSGGSTSPATPLPTEAVSPLPIPGPYAVACSNIEQDFSQVASGDNVEDYWNGKPSTAGVPRYATDLLADPANTLAVTVNAPNNTTLFGAIAGTQVSYVILACYPTDPANSRADYPLPTGIVVPHMQTGAQPPLFADSTFRYPMIVFSHGYSGSPITSEYLSVLSTFASYGYVVVAPFHGDKRFSTIDIDSLDDAVALLANLNPITALQALRPLSVSASLDLLLAHPQWRDHLDATRIGGFGGSMGGETLLLMAGAGLTSSAGLSWSQVTVDSRLKAAVGYVPYFGHPLLPAFGRDGHGLDGISLPYLAISGTADTTAPISLVEQGLRRLTGTRELVALAGVQHGFEVTSTNDIYTWALTFLDATVRDNPAARKKLSTMGSVTGGSNDSVVIPYNGPVQ